MKSIAGQSVSLDEDTSYRPLMNALLRKKNLAKRIRTYCRTSDAHYRGFVERLNGERNAVPLADETVNYLVAELRSQLDFIHLFHGCRVFADSTYHLEGIKVSTHDLIVTLVSKYVADREAAVAAIEAYNKAHRESCYGIIHTVWSLDYWLSCPGGFSHTAGSELVGNILKAHDAGAYKRFRDDGEPTVFEFKVPVGWLDSKDWGNYVSTMLLMWLPEYCTLTSLADPRSGGPRLRKDVPADLLIGRHICDSGARVMERYNSGTPGKDNPRT